MRIQNIVVPAIATLLALVAVPARAVSIEMQLFLDGAPMGSYDGADLGCTTTDGSPEANCSGTNAYMGGYGGIRMDSWNLFLDEDPVVTANTSVTNLGLVTQQITLIFNLPIVAIPGATLQGGSIQGGATDNNGDGVTLAAPVASAFYTALVDGSPVQTLYAAPQSNSTVNPYDSVNVPSLSFGAPIPSLPGGAALATIGIKLDFTLTPGDTATFSSNFVVQPMVIPVPAAVWMFGSALGLLGWLRRR